MLKAGWVTTYEQAGAEYGEWGKDEFLRIEAEAKYDHFLSWQLSIVTFLYLPKIQGCSPRNVETRCIG
jgi:hypothetical protein